MVVPEGMWTPGVEEVLEQAYGLREAVAVECLDLFGGVGNPSAEAHAARLTQRFADLPGAKPAALRQRPRQDSNLGPAD